MDLTPLTQAPLPIQLHAYAALGAFALGAIQIAGVKGTTRHRALGYTWAGLMLIVAVSSFWVHQIRLWGPWSPIHLLSIFTLVMLPLGVWHAHRHAVQRHRFCRAASCTRSCSAVDTRTPDACGGAVRIVATAMRRCTGSSNPDWHGRIATLTIVELMDGGRADAGDPARAREADCGDALF